MLDVIYDGQCGFCVRALRVCRALDLRGALRFHDANARTQVHSGFPELLDADFDHAMFVVAPDRSVTRGFFAFRRLLWESPIMWLLLPFFYFPGTGNNEIRFGIEVVVPIHQDLDGPQLETEWAARGGIQWVF